MSAIVPELPKYRIAGNVRTVFSNASREQKLVAIRDIGYCAIGAGLLVAGITSLLAPDAWLVLYAKFPPIIASIVGGIWAIFKA